ncbi:hypothetical protein NEFER03_1288 [Nematocida sp. LUAm3]|nr:hypothetical protein NEFER03_1288 [Nematocida sp. LUAm3]KAI5174090.1 hypothetical protein NEFER02_0557 [Nematocida sp. LUAm2]KAI5177167.1 hypothetical protein NEFER01_0442 [Nematocida sp. LUAm1]
MESSNADQLTDNHERSWIGQRIVNIKQYIKKRRVLKYSLYALGGVTCTIIMLGLYLGTLPGETDEDTEEDAYLQEIGNELGLQDLTDMDLLGTAFIAMEKKMESISEPMIEEVLGEDVHKEELVEIMKKEKNIVITEIAPNMQKKDFENIYYDKLLQNSAECGRNDADGKLVICGRCEKCSWVQDSTALFVNLSETAKNVKTPVFLYDTTSLLTPIFKDAKEVFCNINAGLIKYLIEMLMKDEVLFMDLQFTSITNTPTANIPLVCSLFVEGKTTCFAHRFRMRNTILPGSLAIDEMFSGQYAYKGYDLVAFIKKMAIGICSLKESHSFGLEINLHSAERLKERYSSYPIDERRGGDLFKHFSKSFLPRENGMFSLAIMKDNVFTNEKIRMVPKYKFIHFLSHFGEPADKISPDSLFKTLKASTMKLTSSTVEFIRSLLAAVTITKKTPEIIEMYTSEAAHALTLLSTLCKWRHTRASEVTVYILVNKSNIESISMSGIRITAIPELSEILKYSSLLKDSFLSTYSVANTFFSRAHMCLNQGLLQEDRKTLICLKVSKENVSGFLWCNGKIALKETYSFMLFDQNTKALEKESKEQWLLSLIKSLPFSEKSHASPSVRVLPEKITVLNFLGAPKVDEAEDTKEPAKSDKKTDEDIEDEKLANIPQMDILDAIYTLGSLPSKPKTNYNIMIIDTLMMIQLVRANEDKKEKERDAMMYLYNNKMLSSAIKKCLGASLTYGHFQKKDHYGSILPDLEYTKALKKMENIKLVNPDLLYSRAYLVGRCILNVLKLESISSVKFGSMLNHDFEMNLLEWIVSLERFSTLSLRHHVLYYIFDYRVGSTITFDIKMQDKTSKDSADETKCTIKVSSGAFEEKIPLNYLELPKVASDDVEKEKLKLLFSMIFNLYPKPTKKNDPEQTTLRVMIKSYPMNPGVTILGWNPNIKGESESDPKVAISANYDNTKKNAKKLIEKSKHLDQANLPIIINGNIIIPITVIE